MYALICVELDMLMSGAVKPSGPYGSVLCDRTVDVVSRIRAL